MTDIDRLLTLRVDFRDEQAAAEITPEMASRYLTAKGWERGEIAHWVYWTRDGSLVAVRHPSGTSWVDYGRRMVEMLTDVATAEGRSSLAVWWEMRHG